MPIGLKKSYFMTYNTKSVIELEGLFEDKDFDTLNTNVGISVGSYVNDLPYWFIWDAQTSKLEI